MRIKKGVVTSAKMDKTIVVTVHTYERHALYAKAYRKSKKFTAHDPENAYSEGDEVTIYETIPLSKTKRWTVVKDKALLSETK